MFADMPTEIVNRMRYLEQRDAADRHDGTPRSQRLRQVTPDTGQLLALFARIVPEGRLIEIGTSAGYSALWIALACREMGRHLTTFEIDPGKIALAGETFRLAGVEDQIDLVHGDVHGQLDRLEPVSFCFLDAEKETYAALYEAIIPRMVSGGLFIADNVISHADVLQPMVDRARNDVRVDAMVIPIGKGELVCRKR